MSEVSVNSLTSTNNAVVFKKIAKSSDYVTLLWYLYCIAVMKVGKEGSTWEEIQSQCYGAMPKWLGIGLSIQGSWVQNHRVASTSNQILILPRSIR